MNPTDKKAVIAIDVDDVLWDLNERVCANTGINMHKIVTYYTKDNPILNEDEIKKLSGAYGVPGLHLNMKMYDGAKELLKIAEHPKAEAWICSNCVDEESRELKLQELKAYYGKDYGAFKEQYNIVPIDSHIPKTFPKDMWLLIDDSPHNAAISNAKHILMPRKPWNTSLIGMHQMGNVIDRVKYYGDLYEATDIILDLLKDYGEKS